MTEENKIRFLIEGVTAGVIEILISERHLTLQDAMDTLFLSNTYRKLERKETGLYYQSPVYVYDMLSEELSR